MLKELESTCIDGLYIKDGNKLVIDTNKLKYEALDKDDLGVIGRHSGCNVNVKLLFSVGDVVCVYHLAGRSKALVIGSSLYEFNYATLDDSSTMVQILKGIIGMLNEHNVSILDTLGVIKGLLCEVFKLEDRYIKVKYLEYGGYLVYLGNGDIVELDCDGRFKNVYSCEYCESEFNIGVLNDKGVTRVRTVGEYLGDISWGRHQYLKALGYLLVYDYGDGCHKLIEYTGINRCRIVDTNYNDYLEQKLRVSSGSIKTLYFRPMDMVGGIESYSLYYRGEIISLFKGNKRSVKGLVKDRDRFIEWYNSCIDKGWDYSMINSLLNYNNYNLDIFMGKDTKALRLQAVEVVGSWETSVRYNSFSIGLDGKLE